MSKFAQLQAEHQRLLERKDRGEPPASLSVDVNRYIQDVISGAQDVPETRDRGQLRANLRFWASYIFDQTGVYPETNLQPSTLASEPVTTKAEPRPVPPPAPNLLKMVLLFAVLGVAIVLFCVIVPAAGIAFFKLPGANRPSPTNTLLSTATASAGATSPPQETEITIPETPLPSESAAVTPSPFPTSQAVDLTPSPPGPDALDWVPMQASFSRAEDPQGCAARSLDIAAGEDSRLPGGSAYRVSVTAVGAGDLLAGGSFQPDGDPLHMDLPSDQPGYFVDVSAAGYTFDSFILLYAPDCKDNQVTVRYQVSPQVSEWSAEKIASLLQQNAAQPGVNVNMTLSNWGPSPWNDGYIAELVLEALTTSAPGGDQDISDTIFWARGAAVSNASPSGRLANNHLLLNVAACATTTVEIGVTAGGVSTRRNLNLVFPDCQTQP